MATNTKTVPKDYSDYRQLPVVLGTAEVEALLSQPNQKAPTGLRNYLMLVYFLHLGLRVSEAINLKVDHLDWQSGKVSVLAGKGDRDRVLWLKDKILVLTNKMLEARPAPSEYVFSNLKGGQLIDRIEFFCFFSHY